MNRFGIKKSIISVFLTIFVLGLLLISGPASALTLTLTQPNDANKGADVSFSVTAEVNDPDLVPTQYTTLTITGPGGFLKTCRINNDGTDDCADVDVTVSQSNVNYLSGAQYGYDAYLGTGYNLGNGFGYQSTIGTGKMTFDIVWHTPSTLTDGIYNTKVDIYAQGSLQDHTFSSSSQLFTISTASAPPSGGGGGGGGGTNEEFRARNSAVESTITTSIPSTPVIAPITPTIPTTPEITPVTPTTPIIPTGAAILNTIKSNPIAAGIVALLVLGIIAGAIYYIKRK